MIEISRRKLRKTQWFEFWAISKSDAYAITCHWTPSMTFWTISRSPVLYLQFILCYMSHIIWLIETLPVWLKNFGALVGSPLIQNLFSSTRSIPVHMYMLDWFFARKFQIFEFFRLLSDFGIHRDASFSIQRLQSSI